MKVQTLASVILRQFPFFFAFVMIRTSYSTPSALNTAHSGTM